MEKLINAQDAINELAASDLTAVDFRTAAEIIKRMPPGHRKGKWVKKTNEIYGGGAETIYYCPECHTPYSPELANKMINFCFSCGIDLREDKEEGEVDGRL